MSETDSDRPVIITARQRARPAVWKLARACIALARQLNGTPTSSTPQSFGNGDSPYREGVSS